MNRLFLILALLVTAFVPGCENDTSLAFAPLPPAPIVGWSFPVNDSPPICLNVTTETMSVDSQGSQTKTCVWECAYYWTQDGNIGPRRYEKVFIKVVDGWGSYAGDFWENCNEK